MEQDSENQCQYAEATNVGCVRELNEDSIFSSSGLWIVADGMGGHACGEVASAMAIEHITTHFKESGSLDDAIQLAHHAITESGLADATQAGMGTTVVAMCVDDFNYRVAWVGDSRAYLWNDRLAKLTQISEDHSLMVRLINAGLISEQDAVTHPQRHMITQCLGSTEIGEVQVDFVFREWEVGQQILLCSDGLTDEVSDTTISEVMATKVSLEDKVSSLIDIAKKAGGRDNISVILVSSPIKKAPTLFERIRKLFVK